METESTTNCVSSDQSSRNLELFFAKKLYNSCQATDELLKSIEASQDEALARKALALYQSHLSSFERPWDQINFLYGLGLIYMHFNAYNWAVKAFRDALYMQPGFTRSKDVHTRLGLIFKSTGRYELSERHFKLAINDSRDGSGTCSRSELEFHLAHLHEIQGRLTQAKEAYERLLRKNDLCPQLSANIHRQLGWMYFHHHSESSYSGHHQANSDFNSTTNSITNNITNNNSCSSSSGTNHNINRKHITYNHDQNLIPSNKVEAALNHLNASYGTNSEPKTSYLLGRCLTDIGKFQEAFASYRNVIGEEESTADTWCSIGVLYHKQNQPTDALQAYIRSVQFDKQHTVAWMNLGTLYESHHQYRDALKCYQHVLRSSSNGVDKSLQTRIRYIQKQLAKIENSPSNNGKSKQNSDKLLSLEDMWNLESKAGSETNSSSSSNPILTHPAFDHISAEQVINACTNSEKSKRIDVNVLSDDETPPRIFPDPPPYPPLPPDELYPSTPSIILEAKKDLAVKKLHEFCQSSPISIVKNIATVLNIDLNLFSTKSLIETDPDQLVEISSHSYNQAGDHIDDPVNGPWIIRCQRTHNTISRYATYQLASKDSTQEERDIRSISPKSSLVREQETDLHDSISTTNVKPITSNNNSNNVQFVNKSTNDPTIETGIGSQTSKPNPSIKGPPLKRFKKESSKTKQISKADKIDLSGHNRWRPQLNELNKLPYFIKCMSASNMLTHVGYVLPGINLPFMSMHVTGCKMFGRRAPNRFCSVNLNVGPGDYQWYAVAAEYGGMVSRLCNKSGLDIDDSNWWPRLSDLEKYNIPVYKFVQKSGDLVWIQPDTIYWVQSLSRSNNISWNVGPLNANQYKLASESCEINKLLFHRSEVPIVQMTWNMIMSIPLIVDEQLHQAIIGVLRRGLKYTSTISELIQKRKQSSRLDHQVGRESGPKIAKFCSLCQCEIFNISFMRKTDEEDHCIECARRWDPTFVGYQIKQEYDLRYLMELYDNFIETKKKFLDRQQQVRPD